MSDPHGTEPQKSSPDQPPVPPFDQDAVEAVSDADASLAAETTPGSPQTQLADADAATVGYASPAPQYAPAPQPAGGYGATAHPPQGAPARGYSTAPPTQVPPYPPQAPAAAGHQAGQGYGEPQGYPGAAPGHQPYPQRYAPEGPGTNAYAIASLICSLAGLITGVSAIAGIVLGHIALNKIKETGEEGRSLAIAGLAVGYGLVAIAALIIVGTIAFIALMGTVAATIPTGTF